MSNNIFYRWFNSSSFRVGFFITTLITRAPVLVFISLIITFIHTGRVIKTFSEKWLAFGTKYSLNIQFLNILFTRKKNNGTVKNDWNVGDKIEEEEKEETSLEETQKEPTTVIVISYLLILLICLNVYRIMIAFFAMSFFNAIILLTFNLAFYYFGMKLLNWFLAQIKIFNFRYVFYYKSVKEETQFIIDSDNGCKFKFKSQPPPPEKEQIKNDGVGLNEEQEDEEQAVYEIDKKEFEKFKQFIMFNKTNKQKKKKNASEETLL
jgi:hypothetical protein